MISKCVTVIWFVDLSSEKKSGGIDAFSDITHIALHICYTETYAVNKHEL